MGLITSVNDISKAIESEKKQKQREKEQKQLEKIRQSKIKRKLEQYFENKYKTSSNYEKTTYFLIQNKQFKKPYYELIRIKEKEQKQTIKQYKEAEKMQKEINKQQEIKSINQYKILETFIIIILLPLILVLGIIKGLLQK